ncbi:hypothetical protein [Agrococcus jejuensis]|uniref:Uncharacterized protein n=1 Tax=Agrococcus jejuensis TaxID=399736 RepID=A0A1G8C0V1_9MICO|nr:hypothetical protein [Agrococcus jejuensis]SDH38959.1 hypothetical protein SAMN04489720_1121 [Agrococcus jejuensis]
MAARASRIATTIGAIALATLLASCTPAVDVDDETVGASATPTPSASPEPTPEPTRFTTRNGTASFEVPAGWTVEDTSALQPRSNHGGPIWQNSVALVDEDGVRRAAYLDGYGDDVRAASELGDVRSIPAADGLHAAVWWTSPVDGSGSVWMETGVVADPAAPFSTVVPEGFDRLHTFVATLTNVPECASVVDRATATACLDAPGTTEALELLATLELEPLPWDAMPEGVDPVADAPWIEHTTPDGALTFSYPSSWSLVTHDVVAGGPGGTFVTLVTPDGYQALDIRTGMASGPWGCDPAQPNGSPVPIEVLSGEAVDPFATASIDPGADIQLVTFDFGGGTTGVALLRAPDVAVGCYDPSILAGSGLLSVTTPWGTDMQGLIYHRYPGGVGFVGSYEHGVMLEVARSVAVNV